MPVPILEAFADAITSYEGWKPWSRSYRNRNPGNLRPVNPTQPSDDGGYRVFSSLEAGYNALLADLHGKFTGHNSHGLGANSTLLQFFSIYAPAGDQNAPLAYSRFVAGWLHSVYKIDFMENDTLFHVVSSVGQETLIYGVVNGGSAAGTDESS